MRRMAEAGRGTYTNIGEGSEVMVKMTALLDRLKAPAVRELAVRVDGAPLDLTPQRLPDLYAGEPLVLLGKGDELKGTITVSGMVDDKPWSQKIDLGSAGDSPAVARLWANRRIADIEARRWSGQIEEAAADAAIAELGLAYGIVTTQTSLVAEDETPSRPANARLTREELPLLLPKGWDFDKLLGNDVPPSEAPAPMPGQSQEMELPQTATGFLATLYRGFGMLALGLLGLLATTRRRFVGAQA
jgi:Ca-activated chloride channel family protein